MQRNLMILLCAVFVVGGLVLSLASGIFLLGVAGWLFAALQVQRLHNRAQSSTHQGKTQAVDMGLLVLATIILSTGVFTVVNFFQETPSGSSVPWSFARIQNEAYAFIVLFGGWALGWFQTGRHIRGIRASMSDEK